MATDPTTPRERLERIQQANRAAAIVSAEGSNAPVSRVLFDELLDLLATALPAFAAAEVEKAEEASPERLGGFRTLDMRAEGDRISIGVPTAHGTSWRGWVPLATPIGEALQHLFAVQPPDLRAQLATADKELWSLRAMLGEMVTFRDAAQANCQREADAATRLSGELISLRARLAASEEMLDQATADSSKYAAEAVAEGERADAAHASLAAIRAAEVAGRVAADRSSPSGILFIPDKVPANPIDMAGARAVLRVVRREEGA